MTFSAGLAAGGMRPFCNIYSAFSQRAYDQIIHDVALQRLPVVLCFDRAGLVGEDGATHHGAFDLAAYRSIPDTIISAPRDELELKRLMHTALAHDAGPFIIRYPRGMGEGTPWRETPAAPLEIGRAECLLEGSEVAVLAIGPSVNRALEAAAAWPEGSSAPSANSWPGKACRRLWRGLASPTASLDKQNSQSNMRPADWMSQEYKKVCKKFLRIGNNSYLCSPKK